MRRVPKSLPEQAAEYIKRNSLISAGDHVLAAVSGGPDSVALLAVLTNLKDALKIERITVIHFDHQLRGDESDGDREFVRALALSAGLDFRCGRADVRTFARSRKISLEMAGRECRRSFFLKAASELNAARIALGHTADDQAEEVILRILRGTGPAGIRAMSPSAADGIIRPLLFATRDQVLEYLREGGMEFRSDSTNLFPSCQRNFLRLKVFPLLRKAFHPRIAQTITRCADLAREEESWWALQIGELWRDICPESSQGRCSLDLDRLKQLHPALKRRVLRLAVGSVKGDLSGVGLVHLEPLIELVSSGKTGKSVRVPGGIEAVRHRSRLLIRSREHREPKGASNEVLRIDEPGIYVFGEYSFEFRFCDRDESGRVPDSDQVAFETGGDEPLDPKPYAGPGRGFMPSGDTQFEGNLMSGADCVLMDSEKLRWPLELRYRRPGDRFRPLGMTGSKKLQDFFTDCMVRREERKDVPLVCDSEKICWVAGMRLDERVKVEASSRKILIAKLLTKGAKIVLD
jgi:tRNA(Ile)-lysidine synthase